MGLFDKLKSLVSDDKKDTRDVLLEDVAQRNIPLSHKKLRRALKAITRSESYLCAMKARYPR